MARRKHRNVYAGPDSTAKIPVRGKVNEPWEILELAYATAIDAFNGVMLSRISGREKKATPRLVHGRFWVLRRLADRFAPQLIPMLFDIERLVLDYLEGKIPPQRFLFILNGIFVRLGFDPRYLAKIREKIARAER